MKRFLALFLVLIAATAIGAGVYVDDNGTLREITGIYVNDNGTLREITGGYVNDNGTLRQFYSGVSVDASTIVGQTNSVSSPSNAYSGIRFLTDGTWEINDANDTSGSFASPEDSGTWLVSGSASSVYVVAEDISGTGFNWLDAGLDTCIQLNATRTWGDNSSDVGAGVPHTQVVAFHFYSDSGCTDLLDETANLGYVAVKTP